MEKPKQSAQEPQPKKLSRRGISVDKARKNREVYRISSEIENRERGNLGLKKDLALKPNRGEVRVINKKKKGLFGRLFGNIGCCGDR